jgi:hypothetical protein
MLGLALWNEGRPAPSLPDAVLSLVPRIELVARYNYHLWLLAYVPPALWLYRRDRAQFLECRNSIHRLIARLNRCPCSKCHLLPLELLVRLVRLRLL